VASVAAAIYSFRLAFISFLIIDPLSNSQLPLSAAPQSPFLGVTKEPINTHSSNNVVINLIMNLYMPGTLILAPEVN